jgi:hypothetical protein
MNNTVNDEVGAPARLQIREALDGLLASSRGRYRSRVGNKDLNLHFHIYIIDI